jgi:hypothetical protein
LPSPHLRFNSKKLEEEGEEGEANGNETKSGLSCETGGLVGAEEISRIGTDVTFGAAFTGRATIWARSASTVFNVVSRGTTNTSSKISNSASFATSSSTLGATTIISLNNVTSITCITGAGSGGKRAINTASKGALGATTIISLNNVTTFTCITGAGSGGKRA